MKKGMAFLSVLLLILCLAGIALAASGENGNCTWTINGDVLTIAPKPGTDGMLANGSGSVSPWVSYTAVVKKSNLNPV